MNNYFEYQIKWYDKEPSRQWNGEDINSSVQAHKRTQKRNTVYKTLRMVQGIFYYF